MPLFRINISQDHYPPGFNIYYSQETDMVVAKVQEEGVKCSKAYNREEVEKIVTRYNALVGLAAIPEAIFADMSDRFPGLSIWT